MRVLKFGGTSMLHGFEQVLKIIQAASTEPTIVVVSALAKVTDLLRKNQITQVASLHAEFCAIHGLASVSEIWDHVRFQVKDENLRISYGEKCSALMLAKALNVPYFFTDGMVCVRTKGPLACADIHCLDEWKQPEGIIVVTGFIGIDKDTGKTSLLQGSSDATATALANYFGCVAEIYTDVDGILSGDPHIISNTKRLMNISKSEASEMAFAGSSVIHPMAIQAAGPSQIEIISTFTGHKTCIGQESSDSYIISYLPCETLVSISDPSLIDRVGSLARIFNFIARSGHNIKMLTQSCSQLNICFVIDRVVSKETRDILTSWYKTVKFTPVSIIAVVGKTLKGDIGIASTIFSAVASSNINVLAIAQGSNELSISFCVEMVDGRKAANAVHAWLVEQTIW